MKTITFYNFAKTTNSKTPTNNFFIIKRSKRAKNDVYE